MCDQRKEQNEFRKQLKALKSELVEASREISNKVT